jgi:hypothetical protein
VDEIFKWSQNREAKPEPSIFEIAYAPVQFAATPIKYSLLYIDM